MKRNLRSHYIIVIANIILPLSIGMNFIVKYMIITLGTLSNINFYLFLISPYLGILITCILYFFDLKYFFVDYPYKKFHFNKKWTKFYISGIIIFCINILVTFALILSSFLYSRNLYKNTNYNELKEIVPIIAKNIDIFLWINFSLTCLLCLISFGLMKYARFKIDVELLKRKKGDKIDDTKIDNRGIIVDLGAQSNKNDSKDKMKDDTASAGLTSI